MARAGQTGYYRNRDASGRFTSGANQLGGGAAGEMAGLTAGIARVGDAFEKVGKSGGEAFRGLADHAVHLTARLAEVGVAMGAAFAVHGVVALNNELEQTQISLGAVFQAGGYYKNFESGFSRATDEVAKMKREVMTLPGTFGELAEIMTTIASPASQTGASIDQIRALAEHTMLTAAILKVPQDVAAREMAQLLSGRAGAHNILGTRMGLVGEEAKKFNAEDPAKRLHDIEGLFSKYAGAADRFASSFKANSTTMKDNLLQFEQLATKPLFDKVNHSLAQANAWIDAHREHLTEIANLVGNRLASQWDKLESLFKRVEPIVERIGHHIMEMSDAQIGDKLKHAAEVAVALKLAPGAMSLAGSALGSGGIGSTLAGMGAGAGAAAGAFGAVAFIGAAGAVDDLTDATNKYHMAAVAAAEDIKHEGLEAWTALKVNVEPATSAIKEFGDYLGVGFLQDISAVTKAFHWLTDQFGSNDADSILERERLRNRMLHPYQYEGDRPEAQRGALPSDMGFGPAAAAGLLRPGEGGVGNFWENAGKAAAAGAEAHVKAKASAQNNFTVKIEVRGSEDPSRVARLVKHELLREARNATRSPSVPDYSSPTR
jgi:hypothetical protein